MSLAEEEVVDVGAMTLCAVQEEQEEEEATAAAQRCAQRCGFCVLDVRVALSSYARYTRMLFAARELRWWRLSVEIVVVVFVLL